MRVSFRVDTRDPPPRRQVSGGAFVLGERCVPAKGRALVIRADRLAKGRTLSAEHASAVGEVLDCRARQ